MDKSLRMVVMDKFSSGLGSKLLIRVTLSQLPRQELCGEYVELLFIQR